MIILISEKEISKKKMEKLAEPMDYYIMDATDEKGKGLADFNKCKTTPGLMIPKKCHKKKEDDFDLTFDTTDKASKAWKKFKKSDEFRDSVFAIFKGLTLSNGRINIFVVLKKKDYKEFAKKMKKAMYQVIGIDEDECKCIYLYDEMNKKDLSKELSSKKLKKIERKINTFETDVLKLDKKKKDR